MDSVRLRPALGWREAFAYRSEAEIFAEHTRLTAGTALDMTGIDYPRLRQLGSIQWPCPAADHPGTERLFTDRRFATASGRADAVDAAYAVR